MSTTATTPRADWEIVHDRDALLEEAEGLSEAVQAGTATAEQTARFTELTEKDGPIAKLDAELAANAEWKRRGARIAEARRNGEAFHAGMHVFGPAREPEVNDGHRSDSHEPLALMDADGRWHPTAEASKPIAKAVPQNSPTAGELLAFWATNDQRHLHGKNPMAAVTGHGGGAAGGFLIPSTISGQLIDKARAAMVAGRAGIRSMTLDSAEMTIVKVANDPTGGYVRELETITASTATFERLVMRPKKYAILIPISREAIEDGENLPGILQQTAQASIAQAVDLAVLRGTGAEGEPTGIMNTAGVNTTAGVGTPTSYSQVLGAVRKIYDANYSGDVESLAWIHSPREWETYAGLVTTGSGADGQPLQVPPAIAGLPSYTTTAMPVNEGSGEDESSMLIGDFSQAVLAFRNGAGVSVEFLNAGTAAAENGRSINAVTNDATWLRLTTRFDVGVLRPDHFTALSGVTAS